uniref:Uncharacterized protein n=1 Tax=Rhinolophus ferrumequinum TaxID=59479 RepID=A0A671G0P9_RHIFE
IKMQRTAVIHQDHLCGIQGCFTKLPKNMSVDLCPCFRDVQTGSIITVGECLSLSRLCLSGVTTEATGTKKRL